MIAFPKRCSLSVPSIQYVSPYSNPIFLHYCALSYPPPPMAFSVACLFFIFYLAFPCIAQDKFFWEFSKDVSSILSYPVKC